MSNYLEHSPADIIRTLLIDLGVATTPSADGDWPAYAGREPNTPDNVVTVYDTEGTPDGRSMIDGEVWKHHGFQIRLRCNDQYDGWMKIDAIAKALEMSVYLATVSVGDDAGTGSAVYTVYAINRKSGPLSIGTEPESKRFIYTYNAVAAIRQTP